MNMNAKILKCSFMNKKKYFQSGQCWFASVL